MTSSRFTFKGTGEFNQSESPNWPNLHRVDLERLDDPKYYMVEDEGLVAAVNTALTLGMPLLLTGEPGVGKTQLAYRIAHELGCSPIFFPVKSTTEAQDLFYFLDHLRRLHAAQTDKERMSLDVRDFLTFQGLGLAILRAMPPEKLKELRLEDKAWPDNERQHQANKHIMFGERQPSVVLIDEIDKAPPDFCNDILEEVRRLQFLLPEIKELENKPISIYGNPGNPTEEEKKYRPQIVITSNDSKGLPDAFLRRCIYYQIDPPTKTSLENIILNRLKDEKGLPIQLDETTRAKAIEFFWYLRDCKPEKPPSTAELLNWLLSLHEQNCLFQTDPDKNSHWQNLAQCCLLKKDHDSKEFKIHLQNWQGKP